MKVSEAFPSSFLKAEDLGGKEVTLTITGATFEELGQGKDKAKKIILAFRGTDKKLVCNKTNSNTISKLYGDDTDLWIGQRITILARDVDYQGETKLAIRVSLKKPDAAPVTKAQAAPVLPPEEPPFPGDEESPF